MILGLAGIIVAMILFLVLVYKGFSSYYIAPICAIIVAVTNALNPVEAFATTYVTGMTDIMIQIFPIILLGCMLGKLISDVGAATSIANTLYAKFVANKTGDTQIKAAVLVVVIFSSLLTYCGISGYVLVFTLFPIFMIIAEKTNIPRRYVPAMLCANCGVMAAPGAPQVNNVIACNILKTNPTAAFIPGIIAVILIEVGVYFTLSRMIIKAQRNGEIFDYGPVQRVEETERKLPNFWVSLIPLILVFVLYTILHLHVSVALTAGILSCLILMGKYIQSLFGT